MSDKQYTALGMMSGSSLDGIDLVLCSFSFTYQWNFEWIKTETIAFSEEWIKTLKSLPDSKAEKLAYYDVLFGKYLGKIASDFIKNCQNKPDFIASHGHTIFHQPEKGYTYQLGNGLSIASACGIKTINNFRQKDILNGGQGAPLVPIGDLLLFPEFDYCLNIGGIANISIKSNHSIKGFDICPANQLTNYLSNQLGLNYDRDGLNAKEGNLNKNLYTSLNSLPYYEKKTPKSLGNEDVRSVYFPILNQYNISIEDKLRTVVEHIAHQIGCTLGNHPEKKVLITGGGAHNHFLRERLQLMSNVQWVFPDTRLIDFKEALIFAFMGLLRLEGKNNCLASVTGAIKDSSSGDVHLP
ncbi:MAG: anhydro-N-acetylmuramic acid kinase [Bacteroidales bacterium]|nr:anhydro-N-acetylmuramic acid kinase [Bacteroidales bacterium]